MGVAPTPHLWKQELTGCVCVQRKGFRLPLTRLQLLLSRLPLGSCQPQPLARRLSPAAFLEALFPQANGPLSSPHSPGPAPEQGGFSICLRLFTFAPCF